MTNNILSGTVSIEDGLKAKEEYAPARKVRVDLNFSVPEGAEATPFLDAAATMANSKVAELLGKKAPTTPVELKVSAAVIPPVEPKAETAAQKKAREKREAAEAAAANAPKEKTKDDLAREAGLPVGDALETLDETPAPAAKVEDELGDLLGDTAPAPITDAELGKLAQQANHDGKQKHADKWAPAKIRELVAKHAGEGKQLRDIPAAKRQAFADELKALVASN